MAILSCASRRRNSSLSEDFSSSSLLAACMEPEASTRNTRFAAVRSAAGASNPWIPICSSQGQNGLNPGKFFMVWNGFEGKTDRGDADQLTLVPGQL
jgi:hypothetical protein